MEHDIHNNEKGPRALGLGPVGPWGDPSMIYRSVIVLSVAPFSASVMQPRSVINYAHACEVFLTQLSPCFHRVHLPCFIITERCSLAWSQEHSQSTGLHQGRAEWLTKFSVDFLVERYFSGNISTKIRPRFPDTWAKLWKKCPILQCWRISLKIPRSGSRNVWRRKFKQFFLVWKNVIKIQFLREVANRQKTDKRRIKHNLLGG